METIHTPKTAAKEIKSKLKQLYPGTKFSVSSEHYAGGNAIRLHWNLGPTTKQVEAIADRYQEGNFDGMTDSYNYDSTLVMADSGEFKALGGAKYVTCSRSYESLEEAQAIDSTAKKILWNSENTLFHKILKDMCTLHKIQYQGQYTKMWQNSHIDVCQCFHSAMSRADFSKGEYGGVKFSELGSCLDLFEIVIK